MVAVIRADEHFVAEEIGNALAQLHHVDGLTLCLSTALDEEGNVATCPITMAPISQNAAMIPDGTIYQMGYIQKWLEENDRSPLTNLGLTHCKILRLSSLKGILTAFFRTCRDRRSQMWAQRTRTTKLTDRTSYDQLQGTLQELDAYIGEARTELTKWQQHIADLEDIAAELRMDADRLREAKLQEARSSANTSIMSVARSFSARQLLTSLRAEAAYRQIHKDLGCFLARRSLLAAKRRAQLEDQLHKACSKGLAPIAKALLLKGACKDSRSP